MKKVFILLAFVTAAMCVNAQDVFHKGNFDLQFGVGAGNLTWNGDGTLNSEGCTVFSVAGEYGILDGLIKGDNGSIGIGGVIATGSKKWNGGDVKFHNTLVAATGSFHYQFVPNLDTYGVVALGLNFQKWNSDLDSWSESNTAFQPEMHVGARYFFTDAFAVMAEAGYGLTVFQMGVAFKF